MSSIPVELKFYSEAGIPVELEDYDTTRSESIPLMVQSIVQPVVQPVPVLPNQHTSHDNTQQHQSMVPAPSQSPQRNVVEISSALTINNVNRFRAVAKAKKNVMFLCRKNHSNRLAMHALKHTGSETPECILMKDSQIQVLDPQETKGMLRRIHGNGSF